MSLRRPYLGAPAYLMTRPGRLTVKICPGARRPTPTGPSSHWDLLVSATAPQRESALLISRGSWSPCSLKMGMRSLALYDRPGRRTSRTRRPMPAVTGNQAFVTADRSGFSDQMVGNLPRSERDHGPMPFTLI